MSTRSAIIRKTSEGYEGIYCHFDGYPEGVGATLKEHYTEESKIAALFALGDLSSLGERVDPIGPHSFSNREDGTTTAYHRDRGDDFLITKGATIEEVCNMIDHEYAYVWDGGKWTVNEEEP